MRLFSSAALRFTNRRVVVYISIKEEAEFGEEAVSSLRTAGKVREELHHLA